MGRSSILSRYIKNDLHSVFTFHCFQRVCTLQTALLVLTKMAKYIYVLFLLWRISVTYGQECQDIGTLIECGYNRTRYDLAEYGNADIIQSTTDAIFYLPQLIKVVESGCSVQTTHFGCAALFPSCVTGRGPCRSLCHRFTSDCGTEFLERLQLESVVLGPLLKCDK